MQWHPIFAHLLRPLVQDHFRVETGMPGGEAPREADIVLLRRTSDQPLPYQGLLRFLTTWNLFEFKGPTVDPRLRDLDLLVELGLGIDRRLNEERQRQQLGLLPEGEVSFWYLASHLGQRFLAEAERKLPGVVEVSAGLFCCQVLQRVVYLVSIDRVPIDPDSVPLHLVNQEPDERALALGRMVIQQPGFWDRYGSWLAFMHPNLWEEIQRMARTTGIEPTLDLHPLFDLVGVDQVIDQLGVDQVIDRIGLDPVIARIGLDQIIDRIGFDRVVARLGLDQVIDRIGIDRVVARLGLEALLNRFGADSARQEQILDWYLRQSTPEQRRKLLSRLQQEQQPGDEQPQ